MKRRLIKVSKWIGYIVLVLAVVHGVASMILGRRYAAEVEKIKDSGDMVSLSQSGGPPVADADNAAIVYERIFRRLQDKENKKSLGVLDGVLLKQESGLAEQEDISKADKRLIERPDFWAHAQVSSSRLEDIVPLVKDAVAKPECRFSVNWADGFGAKLPHYAYLRQIVRVLSAQAIVLGRQGQTDQAYERIELAFKVSQNTCNDPLLIAVLVKAAMAKLANRSFLTVLRYGKPSPAQSAALNADLAATDYSTQYKTAMKGERAAWLWLIDFIMKGGELGDDWAPQSNASLPRKAELKVLAIIGRPALYADGLNGLRYISEQIAVAQTPYCRGEQVRLEKKLRPLPLWSVARRWFNPTYSRVRADLDDARAQTALGQVVLAAAEYGSKNGSYPRTLNDLGVRMPDDPFSGKQLVYKRVGKGFQVYSVGMNLRDDGGAPNATAPTTDVFGRVPSHTGDRVLNWVQ